MMKNRKLLAAALCTAMLAGMLSGCGGAPVSDSSGTGSGTDIETRLPDDAGSGVQDSAGVELGPDGTAAGEPVPADVAMEYDPGTAFRFDDTVSLEDEAVALSASPNTVGGITPVASGTLTASGQDCVIDYSNAADGYFMAKWTGADIRIKVQATGPSGTTYTYNLSADGQWDAFPFSDGSGSYQVRVMRNTSGSKYAVAAKTDVQADLTDAFRPFLTSNQYVDFASSTEAQRLACELCAGKSGELDKVSAVYDWVVDNLSYDYDKAKSVQSGYLPVLDSVISSRKGICFDYAALMAGMLRSQDVACKLVVGYAGEAYHAWISVWVEGQGWVDGVIFFDGSQWQRMDPTYASSSQRSDSVMQYIGDGSHYTSKYVY